MARSSKMVAQHHIKTRKLGKAEKLVIDALFEISDLSTNRISDITQIRNNGSFFQCTKLMRRLERLGLVKDSGWSGWHIWNLTPSGENVQKTGRRPVANIS